MSDYFSRTRVGLCGLALGLCLVGLPFVSADPGGEKCMRVCENRNYFIYGTGVCMATTPATCYGCAQDSRGAQCTYLLKSNPDDCNEQDSVSAELLFPDGCDTPCSTVLSPGMTEAKLPNGKWSSIVYGNLWECK